MPSDPAEHPVDRQACIELCLECYRTCLEEATVHCLAKGGRHADSGHIALMLGCAQLCRTAAEFMLMHSMLHFKVCGVCAEICEACAVSCQQLDDMEHCVDVCRRCATACRNMAYGSAAAG